MTGNETGQTAGLLAALTDPCRRDDAFRQLMRLYGRRLYWHIRRIVVSHDDAEDVLQEVCIKILDNIASCRDEAALTAWLFRVATNEALQHLRRQTHFMQDIDSLNPELADRMEAETPLDADAAEVLFQRALLTLPTTQRIVFNMRYYDELSYDEIAQVTGKSVATLKTNYHYATEKVKNFLKNHLQ